MALAFVRKVIRVYSSMIIETKGRDPNVFKSQCLAYMSELFYQGPVRCEPLTIFFVKQLLLTFTLQDL